MEQSGKALWREEFSSQSEKRIAEFVVFGGC